jgi:hypothetical protein
MLAGAVVLEVRSSGHDGHDGSGHVERQVEAERDVARGAALVGRTGRERRRLVHHSACIVVRIEDVALGIVTHEKVRVGHKPTGRSRVLLVFTLLLVGHPVHFRRAVFGRRLRRREGVVYLHAARQSLSQGRECLRGGTKQKSAASRVGPNTGMCPPHPIRYQVGHALNPCDRIGDVCRSRRCQLALPSLGQVDHAHPAIGMGGWFRVHGDARLSGNG